MKRENKYMTVVKLGSKGQIVIPKEVREMFGLEPGSSLILLADAERGIALNRIDFVSKFTDSIFDAAKNSKSEIDVDESDRAPEDNIGNSTDAEEEFI